MGKANLPLIIVFFFVTAACNEGSYFEDAYCITNVSIIDPNGELRPNVHVVIQDERIISISSASKTRLSSKNKVIDGTGKFLLPGLWDAHVHFAFIEDLAPAMFDLFLAYGVTSVRDTGGELSVVSNWKAKAESDPENSPRVKIAGPLLDGLPNVYDGSSPSDLLCPLV